jgi:hypothetical protein
MDLMNDRADLSLPLLLLDVARDPGTGSIEGRSRLSLAVRAACLIELGDAGRLAVEGRTLRATPGPAPTGLGTTVTEVALEITADDDARPARHWINRHAPATFDAAADELVAQGGWEPTRRGLLARSSPRYSGQEDRTVALREQLRTALSQADVPSTRIRDLALLLEACRGLSNVLLAADRRQGERRTREWAEATTGARPVADAAVAAVRSSSAAYLAAVAS